MEEMYGTTYDCGIEKTGDNHVIKFYTESIGDEFLPQKEELLKKQIELLLDIVFNPVLENGKFVEEYVTSEKENIRQKIEAKIDNKEQYAVDKCIELMYGNAPYSLYKYGYIEDLASITNEIVFNRYKEIIQEAKIDIYVSGNVEENVFDYIKGKLEQLGLSGRTPKYIQNNETTEKKARVEEKYEETKLDVAQGKLVLGLDILKNEPNSRFAVNMYNVILGESATSKLFQNVREKASLAYTARSTYTRQKNNIFIKCGIEIPNKQKALDIIKEQLEDMKNGNFSEEDIQNAKSYMLNGIKSVEEEQDTEITYYMGQEFSGLNTSLDEYQKQIEQITKDQIVDIAKNTQINTILFLRN
ncbi:MAG: insulinase family protein [Clostridia bacterium]|nr:insulinase family protein [Clostridia bacterium]